MRIAVFLDRDNTLIANDADLGDPARVVLLPGVADAVRLLSDLGLSLIAVSNQGGVARGMYTEADVRAVNRRLDDLLTQEGACALTAHYFCPYHPDGKVDRYAREHPWRKPAAGMLLAAARDYDIDLSASWMIGDQARDAAAGKTAGCRTILLGNRAGKEAVADFRCSDLLEAALLIRDMLSALSASTSQ